ncbi:MAG: septation protein SpoVG family protein [Alphaproteobacteria bacterium]
MQISNISITIVKPQGGLVGFASLVLEGAFYVGGIAIHERLDGAGYRLTYPTRKSANHVFNICHPIDRQASKIIENAILQKLKAVINESRNNAGYDCPQFAAR